MLINALLSLNNAKIYNYIILNQAKACYSFRNHSKSHYSLDVRYNKTSIKTDNGQEKDYIISDTEKIIIPKRITRGPTDILKALASTVKRNHSSPHYKYQDDPYLIPVSNVNKRSYALAKEAGRTAATFMLKKYPDSFAHNPAEPNIPALNAPIKLEEIDPDNPDSLRNCIESLEITGAIDLYKSLKSKDIVLDDDILHSLLELVCYYGNVLRVKNDNFEERWLKQQDQEQIKTKWPENHLVYEIFNDIGDKNDRSYRIFVKGLAKHFQIERAYLEYKELKDRKFKGDVGMYNQILQIVPYLRESSEQRWNLVKSFVDDMTRDDVRPNIGTFNALLENIVKLGKWQNAKELALEVFAEMKECGVEPSLGSYYYLLTSYCKHSGPRSHILIDIMKQISGKTFRVRHNQDLKFFVAAMDVCNNHLSDPDLALKVHDLYQLGDNGKLIGNAFTESVYYQHFFNVTCRMESIERFFEIYNTYVPHCYTPEPSVMENIIDAIKLNEKLSYLPRIWSDVILFNHTNRDRIVSKILNIMAKSKQPHLIESFATIAYDVKTRIQSQQDKTRITTTKVNWTGEILGDTMKVFLNASDSEKAWEIFKIMQSEQATIIGLPSPATIRELCEFLLNQKQFDRTIECVKFASETGHLELILPLKDLITNFDLEENFKLELTQLLEVSKSREIAE